MQWRKWRWLLCLALVGILPSFSCPRDRWRQSDQEPAAIPFVLYNDNLVIVKGTIGSIENVNILLDTGTSPTAISTEIAGRLNLRGDAEPLLSSNGKIGVQSAIVPRIDIGPLHLALARVVVQDLSFLRIAIGAVAGLDILGTSNFVIDFGKSRILCAPVLACKKSVRLETQNPYLTVRAKIGGDEFRLLVDSGTPGLLLFRNRLNGKATRLERIANGEPAAMLTATGSMHAEWFRAPNVWLGTHSIGPQIMLVADGDPDPRYQFDGLLGLAKTGLQKVCLDFEKGMFGWE
jgi:predicted aspartyl protease